MDSRVHKVIVIVGTNASGKSSLAISLAKQFDGEVISADSRQVYRGLDIATGKVTPEEMRGVPHHMLDVADPTETYTAADFARDGQHALLDILQRNKLPIIAGGTGFYVDALLNPELLASVPPNDELREELEEKSVEELFARLAELDSKRAQDLKDKGEENLKRRIIRAIEIASAPEVSGVKLPPLPDLDVLWIGIHWDNEELKERIHERTLQRLENDMIDEAKNLIANGISYERLEELGLEYKHLADYLRERITRDELGELIDRDDWKYAKRQRTWFKRNEEVKWFGGEELEGVTELVEGFIG